MNNTVNAIASVFTGKGGTIRLAIAGTLATAIVYEIIENNFKLDVAYRSGSVSLMPSQPTGTEPIPVPSDNADGAEPIDAANMSTIV